MALPVEDYVAIQQLYARYCHAVDLGTVEEWLDCFAPGGGLQPAGGQATTDRTALTELFHAGRQRGITRHWNFNVEVAGHDGGARGTCNLMLLLVDTSQPTVVHTSRYDDELVKADGAWKFARRTLTRDA